MSRRLVVLRHAKTEPYPGRRNDDYARELTDRGHADAHAVGQHLVELGVSPQRALVSSARRTHQTWLRVAECLPTACRPDLLDELYAADVDTVLRQLRALPEECLCAIVVGHNPTMELLGVRLADPATLRDTDSPASALAAGFPTSGMASLDFDDDWAELAPGTGRLVDFFVGRG